MKMKLVAGVFALAMMGWGAPITWSVGPSFVGPNGHLSIAQQGTLVYALNWGGGTVNAGGIEWAAANMQFSFGVVSPGTNDANFNDLIGSFGWVFGSNSRTITGLTPGRTYLLQLFLYDNRSCCSGRVSTLSDGQGNEIAIEQGSGNSIFGTFTADATTQILNQAQNGSAIYNAEMLRDITQASNEVPEPASLLLTAGALVLLLRRR